MNRQDAIVNSLQCPKSFEMLSPLGPVDFCDFLNRVDDRVNYLLADDDLVSDQNCSAVSTIASVESDEENLHSISSVFHHRHLRRLLDYYRRFPTLATGFEFETYVWGSVKVPESYDPVALAKAKYDGDSLSLLCYDVQGIETLNLLDVVREAYDLRIPVEITYVSQEEPVQLWRNAERSSI
jgi:hypothetical protein